MKRTLLYAHWDRAGLFRAPSERVLEALAPFVDHTEVLSTALRDDEAGRLRARLGARGTVRHFENLGFDFGMWAAAFPDVGEDVDEVLLVNSSLLGPFAPVDEVFRRLALSDADLWSLTESQSPTFHLQSAFLVVRRRVLRSSELRRFFDSVLPFENKWGTIGAYELGLTAWLTQNGFRAAAGWPLDEITPPGASFDWLRRRNPMMALSSTLLARGLPFVKTETLVGRPHPGAGLLERGEHAIHRERLRQALRRRSVDVDALLAQL